MADAAASRKCAAVVLLRAAVVLLRAAVVLRRAAPRPPRGSAPLAHPFPVRMGVTELVSDRLPGNERPAAFAGVSVGAAAEADPTANPILPGRM